MNRTRLSAFIWIFFLFLAQNTFLSSWPSRSFPALLVTGTVFYGVFEGPVFGLFAGLYAGFFLDVLGTGRLGIEAAVWGTLGLLAGLVSAKIFRESFFTRFLLTPLAGYTAALSNLAVLKCTMPEERLDFSVLGEAFHFWELAFTACLAPLVFGLLKRVSFIPKRRR